MAAESNRDGASLIIEIEPWLRERVEAAAAAQGIAVRDYVAAVLREALGAALDASEVEQTREWSRLSIPVFARDWESDADAVYDDLE